MWVASLLYHTCGYLVVQTEVEDGVHHTRHRSASTRTYRNQKWILWVAELAVHQRLSVSNGCINLISKKLNDLLLAYFIIFITSVCCYSESWRYRNTNVVHFGKVSSLATEYLTH